MIQDGFAEDFSDFSQQGFGCKRFQGIVVRSVLDGLEDFAFLPEDGEHYYRDIGGFREVLEQHEGGEAVEVGHDDVEQNDIGSPFAGFFDACVTVAGGDDVEAVLEDFLYEFEHHAVVVDDEHGEPPVDGGFFVPDLAVDLRAESVDDEACDGLSAFFGDFDKFDADAVCEAAFGLFHRFAPPDFAARYARLGIAGKGELHFDGGAGFDVFFRHEGQPAAAYVFQAGYAYLQLFGHFVFDRTIEVESGVFAFVLTHFCAPLAR